jgi:hypothetical protein
LTNQPSDATSSAVIDGAGAWEGIAEGYVLVGGAWQPITQVDVLSGGVWCNLVP